MAAVDTSKLGGSQATDETAALRARLAEAEAALAALKAKGQGRLTLKVSEKGAVSLYGLMRFPVTLYASGWERLLAFIGAPASNPVAVFLRENAPRLARKE